MFSLFISMSVSAFLWANAQAGYGNLFAYINYKSSGCSGSYGKLLTTDPLVFQYSGDANFIDIEFNAANWFAVGWCKGETEWGPSNGLKFYYDQRVANVYSGGFLGQTELGTWHTYWITYQLGTTYKWTVYIDGIVKKTTAFLYRTGLPTADVEICHTLDDIDCHVKELQYALTAGRIVRWYPWDGYGTIHADLPLGITTISNVEWTATSY